MREEKMRGRLKGVEEQEKFEGARGAEQRG